MESGNDSPGAGMGDAGEGLASQEYRNGEELGSESLSILSSPLAWTVGLHTVGPGPVPVQRGRLGLHLTVFTASGLLLAGVCPLLASCPHSHHRRMPLSLSWSSLCKP